MTRKVPELNKVAPEAYIEINPDDAAKLGIRDGDLLKVSSRRGSIDIKALISERPARGTCIYPIPL